MSAAAVGFFGKIPARGDFVRSGLPAGFVTQWDAWLQRVLPVSRELMAEEWLPAWLEAPVWRFALDGGVCGPEAVLGLWMPSVDRAGRHFPLTLATAVAGAGAEALAANGGDWLDAAERAGRDALAEDTEPQQLAAALTAPPAIGPGGAQPAEPGCRWWTEGGPRVAARAMQTSGLPDGPTFAGMLDDRMREIAPCG